MELTHRLTITLVLNLFFLNCKAIGYALEKGHVKLIKLLLNHPRVDPSADNNYGMNFIDLVIFLAIRLASENGHIEAVKLLLNHPNIDPSDNNNIGMNFIEFVTHL
jgi:ankyrin repeat protein